MRKERINHTNQDSVIPTPVIPGASRRAFFGKFGAATAIGVTAGGFAARLTGAPATDNAQAPPQMFFDQDGADRAAQALRLRDQAALAEKDTYEPQQLTNGDETLYPNFIGNCSKSLPHNSIGEVNQSSYQQFLNACRAATAAAFEDLPLAGNAQLLSPMAGVAFELEGLDPDHPVTAPPPTVASQARADEAVEAYWMALCRDVSFSEYASNPVAQAACAELSSLSAFTGPKYNGAVSAQSLFRGLTPEDLVGPYLSQLLLRPILFDSYPSASGQVTVFQPGIDYMTNQNSWLTIQNGGGPTPFDAKIDPQTRYIRNGRDLASLVHLGGEVGPFMAAMSWLASVNAPLNPGNPYLTRRKQAALVTFGFGQFTSLIGEFYYRALKSCWYHKWFVHRTLRPEAYGGLAHMNLTRQASYPLHSDILNSKAVAQVLLVVSSSGLYRRMSGAARLSVRTRDLCRRCRYHPESHL